MVRTPEYEYMLSQGNTQFFPDGAVPLRPQGRSRRDRQPRRPRPPRREPELSDLLRRWLADRRNRPDAPGREQSDEEKARLKALGYIQ